MYQVSGIDFEKSPLSTFDYKGQIISFAEYYMRIYKIKIQNNNQPLLVHKDRKTNREIFLIPELALLTGLTEKQRLIYILL